MKLKDIVQHSRDSITPKDYPERRYDHYSLPAYDNYMTPTIDSGDSIASNKYQVFKNSILISKLNPGTSRVWKIEDCNINSICSTEFVQLNRINTQMCSLRYLYYYLCSPLITGKLKSMASGTSGSHQRVKPKDILDLEINLPILEEQRAIAEALSSLDDKIELLQKQNETLEALAQTLFRQWFIEEADNSWEEYTIGRCAEIIKTSVKPEVNPDETFEHYSLPAYDNHQNPSLDLGIDIKSSKYKVINEAVLISKLNPAISRVWLILDEAQKNSICSTEFVVVKPNSREWMFFIYCLLSANETSEYLGSCASGTSGSHQRIKPIDVLNINFSFNDIESIRRFGLHVQPFFEKISMNRKSIKTLEQTRDTLLPRLMSGQVRIKLD